MKSILNYLFEYKTLTSDQARKVLLGMTRGDYNTAEISAFLTVFQMRTITVEELSGFRSALLELCVSVDLSSYGGIDLCGTGGDGKNTFNISTLASFVVAGAGEKVTKHGNYGVSSLCGSSNVMEYLGYSFKSDEHDLRRDLDRAGICFLHAPLFNPAMKSVASIRQDMGVRTFFNMLGPLVNPSRPNYQLVGVFDLELARLYKYLLQESSNRYAVIHSLDGYDEVSLTNEVKLMGNDAEELLSPSDLGFQKLDPADLYGGSTIEEAANIFVKILKGGGTEAQNSVVIANAGLALKCLHPEKSRSYAMECAKESLQSGSAYQVLKKAIA